MSLLVLTFNRWDRTRIFLDSLEASDDDYSTVDLIWIDNASTDATVAEMKKWLEGQQLFSRTVTCVNEHNVGFLRGVNQGLGLARSGVVALVNNDVVLPSTWLTSLRRTLADSDDVAAVGPVSDGMPWQQALRHRGRGLREVPTLYAFCVLVKRDLFESVGLLDPRFGRGVAEFEEWCERARRQGYKFVVDTDIVVGHPEPHASYTPRVNALLTVRNRDLYLKKWGKGPYQWGDRTGPDRRFARSIVCRRPGGRHLIQLCSGAAADEEILVITDVTDQCVSWIPQIRADERLNVVVGLPGASLKSLVEGNSRADDRVPCPSCQEEFSP